MLVMGVADVGGSAVASVQPDLYGLLDGHNWVDASGSILGESLSQANFAAGTEEHITVDASSCINYGGFLTLSGFPPVRRAALARD